MARPRLRCFIAPLVLLLCLTSSCQQQVKEEGKMEKVDLEADIAAIKEMLNQYAIGCNTGDFDLWMSLWADDGVQMPPGTPTRIGKAQIREGMQPVFDEMNLDIAIVSI